MKGPGQFSTHKAAVTLTVLLGLSLLGIAFSSPGSVGGPVRLLGSVFGAVQRGVSGVGSFVGSSVHSVRELGQLREDYEDLLDRLREYEAIERDIRDLEREIEALREALGFSREIAYENIPARVIARDPGNFFATMTLNRGARDGVEADMPVIAVQDGRQGLIGRVKSVTNRTSTVKPVFDSSSYVAARLRESRYEGLIQGGGIGSTTLTMRYVPDSARAEVTYGDMIVTSGMSAVYPPEIQVGTVDAIHSRPYETSLEIDVAPLIDFSRLEYVFVLAPEELSPADEEAGR